MKIFREKFLFAVFFLLIITGFMYATRTENKKIENNLSQNQEIRSYPELNALEAKSYIVFDVNRKKVIFSKEEHKQFPLASITKLMTGLVALTNFPTSTIIEIQKEDTDLGSASGLVVGEKWQMKNLLDFSLITSSNDGIHAISRTLDEKSDIKVLSLMNAKSTELGLSDTFFLNQTGLDIDELISGAYSSASDMAKLFVAIYTTEPSLFEETRDSSKKFVSESNILHIAKNTNKSINNIPSLIGSKTGFTDLSGGNLGIIFDAGFGHPIVIIVLGSSQEGRFTDIETLTKLALKDLNY